MGNGLQLLGELHPDLAAIAAQADITNAMAGLEPDRVPELWWTSYQKALDVGLAVEVDIPDGPAGPPGPAGPHLEVLLVTGLSDQDPRALFERHADRGSLGVVTPMSPTNTVAGAPAADLGRDPATWLAVAQAGGGGTFDGLAAPLTGAPLLDGVPDADAGTARRGLAARHGAVAGAVAAPAEGRRERGDRRPRDGRLGGARALPARAVRRAASRRRSLRRPARGRRARVGADGRATRPGSTRC